MDQSTNVFRRRQPDTTNDRGHLNDNDVRTNIIQTTTNHINPGMFYSKRGIVESSFYLIEYGFSKNNVLIVLFIDMKVQQNTLCPFSTTRVIIEQISLIVERFHLTIKSAF